MKRIIFDEPERVGRWVCEAAGGRWVEGNPAIGMEVDGQLVVGVMYDSWTGSSIAIHSRCDDPRALNREFYRHIFGYPFNQLGVRRLTGLVGASNMRARRLDERLGFRQEASLADYFPDGDAIVYIMRREDCRFL
ncbi:hypothetical protein [Chromobacterium subtsugae]|uniref:hypothetical protein n=1 Tax=Chromobacterium subtsugae TaxID=251747 RepID=UPI0006417403|nr:hypothetical protein [Chromobacterium subtsugae]